MNDNFLAELVIAVIALAALITIGVLLDAHSCHEKWKDTGFQSRYGVFPGCRVSKDGKTWLPEDNYREVAQ